MEETSTQSKLQGGEVVSVGEGKTIAGKTIDISVKVGNIVFYSKVAGDDFKAGDGSNYIIIRASDVRVVIS
ncbi:Co-chaperonin GroES [Linum perenne]